MSDILLLESGSRVLLESGSILLLESVSVGAVTSHSSVALLYQPSQPVAVLGQVAAPTVLLNEPKVEVVL